MTSPTIPSRTLEFALITLSYIEPPSSHLLPEFITIPHQFTDL